MGKSAGLCILVLALLCLPATLLAAPGTEKTVVITAGEQPPLISSSGGIIDMGITKALEREGYKVKIEWVPVGRMLQLLQQDSLDVFITASNTPGQQYPHVSFLEAQGVFFYKKSRFPSLEPGRLEDLAGKRVATVVNSPLTSVFSGAGMVVDEGPIETLMTKLDLGRVDLAATSDVGGILMINKLFPGREGEFSYTDFAYSRLSAGLYAKNDPALLAAVRKGLAGMKADGSLVKALRDFFGEANWRRVRIMD